MTGTITIYEDWDERPDGVYYKWKLPEEPEWHEKLTAHKQKPVIRFKYLSEEEYKEFYATKREAPHPHENTN